MNIQNMFVDKIFKILGFRILSRIIMLYKKKYKYEKKF